jgi:DNA polymerase-3 subunit alpha
MNQTTLDSFLSYKPIDPKKPIHSEGTAKEVLEPLFVRPIPSNPRYTTQLHEEYELIDKNKFTPVFLQVCTILELIRQISEESGKPIIHIIRGSAGSSLVCFLLGITQVDPLLHGIQLARFMNTHRKDMPDIDIDVPYNRREEIYGRIATTWPGMVARISNYCMWRSKTAMRESIKELLRSEGEAIPNVLLKRNYDALKILGGDTKKLDMVKQITKTKVGTIKNYSKHCGGIVIFENEGEVPEDLVFQRIEANGKPLVQINLNKDDTESKGFIKIDLLSNRGLAQLADICSERPLTAYPSRDAATERIFEKGWNIGITFGESRGMRKLFMEMRPRNMHDIAIALALIRPAAAAEGRKQEFLEKWKLVGEDTGPLMRPIIYDDDAICKIRASLGCTRGEADTWRKAFAKGKARHEFHQKMAALGHSHDVITSVIDDLNQLVYYSFCKSHAISYAQLVWALGYWKAHRPHEFWAATLNHCHSEYRKWVHYREARCSGLDLTYGPPPYTVGTRNGNPALLSSSGFQTMLVPLSPIKEYKEYGYWTSEAFLPSCGLWMDSQKRLDGKQTCQFRGLIASCRTIKRDWGDCTLICLGVANKRYIDLVLPGKRRSDLFKWAVLEGDGILKKADSVDVSHIRGVSLQSLQSKK